MKTIATMAGALALLLPTLANAAPKLEGAIGDHAVLQRGRPIIVTGRAAPGEKVMVNLAGRSATGQADREGRFRIALPPLSAGGPHQMLVDAPSGRTFVDDLLIGDVFLCSGQSNMELSTEQSQNSFQIWGATDPQMRLMTVAKRLAEAPLDQFNVPPAWTAATPETIAKFSAVCFYAGQDLRRTAKVPVGLIHSSWGGSRISAWMAPEGLRAGGLEMEAKALELHARDAAGAEAMVARQWETWWREQSGLAGADQPWRGEHPTWSPVPAIGYFGRWGQPAMANYLGMLWFEKTVDLTPAQAAQGAILSLGLVDDADRTWVNGKAVGGSSIGAPRRYRLAPGTLVAGRNLISINDDNVYADGGLAGPAQLMRLQFDDGTSVPLDTGWRYALAGRPKTNAPRAPWDDINGAGVLYNAMISPLGPVGLAGAIWYQGESDTGLPGYQRRLAAMMADWRRQFETPALPFAIVQLSAYGAGMTKPGESGWAEVRDAQRRAAQADGHAAAVVTLDLGDPYDIHPGEKQEVGRRTADALRVLAYGEAVSPGPRIATAQRAPDGSIVLTFAGASGDLVVRSADTAIGFELCAADGGCRYAPGRVAGDKVTLQGDGGPVGRVRYGWADSPAVNLFDRAGRAVGSFEIQLP
ncbi:MAG: 9-O-acetylesterase [Caulobacter sp.]|nr:9-O-acetylesterase [Caulobacter sp.]